MFVIVRKENSDYLGKIFWGVVRYRPKNTDIIICAVPKRGDFLSVLTVKRSKQKRAKKRLIRLHMKFIEVQKHIRKNKCIHSDAR